MLRLCRRSRVWFDVVDVHIFELAIFARPNSDFFFGLCIVGVTYHFDIASFLIFELRVETNKRDELMYAMLNCFGS